MADLYWRRSRHVIARLRLFLLGPGSSRPGPGRSPGVAVTEQAGASAFFHYLRCDNAARSLPSGQVSVNKAPNVVLAAFRRRWQSSTGSEVQQLQLSLLSKKSNSCNRSKKQRRFPPCHGTLYPTGSDLHRSSDVERCRPFPESSTCVGSRRQELHRRRSERVKLAISSGMLRQSSNLCRPHLLKWSIVCCHPNVDTGITLLAGGRQSEPESQGGSAATRPCCWTQHKGTCEYAKWLQVQKNRFWAEASDECGEYLETSGPRDTRSFLFVARSRFPKRCGLLRDIGDGR